MVVLPLLLEEAALAVTLVLVGVPAVAVLQAPAVVALAAALAVEVARVKPYWQILTAPAPAITAAARGIVA